MSYKQRVLRHFNGLFRLAKSTAHEDPELSQRYVEMARKISMRTRVRLPKDFRRLICKYCKSFILPGVTCRVRIQQKREPHVVVTCLTCMKHTRIPLKRSNQ